MLLAVILARVDQSILVSSYVACNNKLYSAYQLKNKTWSVYTMQNQYWNCTHQ